MNRNNIGQLIQVLDLVPVASVAATANGSAIDLNDYEGEIAIVLDCNNVDGTNPTMDVTIEESAASGSGFAAVAAGAIAFTQVTATPALVQKLTVNSDSLKRYIRAVKTLGGTSSPHFLVSVKAYGIKKYPA